MTMKTLILGSAAAIMAVTGAQAADLPAAEPVEYVRICDTYGTGFFYIPGTETCLRVGGYARFELAYAEPIDNQNRTENHTWTRGRGGMFLDARTQTEYGLFRTFVHFRLTQNSGANANGDTLEAALIQFGGLTAGRTTTFFDYGYGYSLLPTTNIFGPGAGRVLTPTNLLAYTFAFGNGFSATLSVEDGVNSRAAAGVAAFTAAGVRSNAYGGHTMPDVVGQLRVAQGWGTLSIAGVYHNVRTITTPAAVSTTAHGGTSKAGWAVKGDLTVNLPMIAQGDSIKVGAAYTEGATDYVGGASFTAANGATSGNLGTGLVNIDGAIDTGTGLLKLTKAWSVYGSFRHFFTPQIWAAITGGYLSVNNPSFMGTTADWDALAVMGTVGYSPVQNLTFAVEAEYMSVDVHGRGKLPGEAVGGDRDYMAGVFRVHADF